MFRKYSPVILFSLLIALSACAANPPTATPEPVVEATKTPAPPPTAQPTNTPALPAGNTPLVISEVMAGDFDFVELYNASVDPINLNGYRMVYRLGTTEEDLPLYTFEYDFFLPPYYHTLLTKDDNDLGMRVDGTFSQQMNVKTGGVGLYAPNGDLVDAVAWGKAPLLFTEGTPAPEMPQEASLERLPRNDAGNYTDSDNNSADFTVGSPNPQSSAWPATPRLNNHLNVRLLAASTVEPGQEFTYRLEVENMSGQNLRNLTVTLPLPTDLIVVGVEQGGVQQDGAVVWLVDALPAGKTTSRQVWVQAPWTYARYQATAYHADIPGLDNPAYGPAAITDAQGGVIPIEVARTLPRGAQVTVEGIATMYTGGYYAGSDNTKFYVQDGTGGIQVQVFDTSGPLPEVSLGNRIRIRGAIEIYRDAIEIVPETLPADVEITGTELLPAPKAMTVAQATGDPNNAGQYIEITGLAARIEEFTYSYEIDLLDTWGNTLLLYVDKLTGLTADDLDAGGLYTIAGILEYYQGQWQLKPRVAGDLHRVYPSVLRLEISAPNTVAPGDPITYTLTAFNHTEAPLTHLTISDTIPAALAEVYDGGIQRDNSVYWDVPTIPPNGGQVSVHFTVIAPQTGQMVVNDSYQATAAEWPNPVTGPAFRTFIGQSVPVWAVQGNGYKSPYVNNELQTEGVVTAIFDPADIPGFFIQEVETDDDPATSAGLFVRTEDLAADLEPGDLVQVRGVVKERSGQTELALSTLTVLLKGESRPEAVLLDPPEDPLEAALAYEALEGMLVQAAGVAVSPISKYGETGLVLPKHNLHRLLKGGPAGLLITVDDNSWVARYDDAGDLPVSIVTGDTVEAVFGPLAYTFGQYKIEPVAPLAVTPGNFERSPSLPETEADAFSLAAYNVENFFDHKEPNPASPPRPSRKEYQRKAAKIANSIAAMGYPTIIGFSEVENVAVLKKVAGQPQLADYDYQAILVEGRDSRGIDVGYLLRGDRVEVIDYDLRLDDEGLFTRGPLLLKSLIHTAAGNVTLYTLVNHFVSLGAGFEATEPRRVKQAQWNLDIAREIQAMDPNAAIAILGDLNTFFDTPAINLMREAGFVHVFDQLLPEERYTYIYQGESEVLDHILVTPNLAKLITSVDILHINADFPPPDPDDEGYLRTSDHDPVVVTFRPE